MRHRVIMHEAVSIVAPPDVREEARQRLQEIAEALALIPANSAFWVSMRVSRMCLIVRGWSFLYELDDGRVHVTGVLRAPRPG
ncbi:MAG TPA: hypothetical protein VG496_16925 [Myxococcales bacterium]|nr:hypothetical protein [Myxococcales bacterium]